MILDYVFLPKMKETLNSEFASYDTEASKFAHM
jgi:hypothetical protein